MLFTSSQDGIKLPLLNCFQTLYPPEEIEPALYHELTYSLRRRGGTAIQNPSLLRYQDGIIQQPHPYLDYSLHPRKDMK